MDVRCGVVSQRLAIIPNAGVDRQVLAHVNTVLHESGQGLAVFLDSLHVERAIQFKNYRTRRLLRHKGDVGAGAQRMLVRVQLRFDVVTRDVEFRAGRGLGRARI